jgi:TATA-box binding protein (TBP) (component of TFIID and TFIIIB)
MCLGYNLEMDKINMLYGHENGYWRPEIFKGFSLCQTDLQVTFIVFQNGKVNVTGLKTLSQLPICQKRAHDLLFRCRKL